MNNYLQHAREAHKQGMPAYLRPTYDAAMRFADNDGLCWAYQTTIARETGRHRNTIMRHIAKLSDLGFIRGFQCVAAGEELPDHSLAYVPQIVMYLWWPGQKNLPIQDRLVRGDAPPDGTHRTLEEPNHPTGGLDQGADAREKTETVEEVPEPVAADPLPVETGTAVETPTVQDAPAPRTRRKAKRGRPARHYTPQIFNQISWVQALAVRWISREDYALAMDRELDLARIREATADKWLTHDRNIAEYRAAQQRRQEVALDKGEYRRKPDARPVGVGFSSLPQLEDEDEAQALAMEQQPQGSVAPRKKE
jgi:hypothetical protein